MPAGTQRKRKKVALGRGLDALLPHSDIPAKPDKTPSKDYFECDITIIRPNHFQPRVQFGDAELAELADSIRSQGIIQPLLIRRTEDGYELVTGERRLRAAKIAGLKTVPVVLKDLSDAEMLEMSIVENIQRENFNPIEEAEAYYRLINEFKLTQEEAAVRVGKSRSAVANFLRLRQLSADIKTSIIDGQVSMGHARALLGAANQGQQRSAWRQIIAKNLSVRQTEALIKRLKSQPQTSPEAPRLALALSICAVAIALVPKAMISTDSSHWALSRLITALPIPPPCPSITANFFICFNLERTSLRVALKKVFTDLPVGYACLNAVSKPQIASQCKARVEQKTRHT